MLEEDEDSEDSDDSGTDAPDNLMMTMKKPWKPSPSPRNKYVHIDVALMHDCVVIVYFTTLRTGLS